MRMRIIEDHKMKCSNREKKGILREIALADCSESCNPRQERFNVSQRELRFMMSQMAQIE